MRQAFLVVVLAVCAGCASFAPSLREAAPTASAFPSEVGDEATESEGVPVNPGFPSPVVAYGISVVHSGHWQVLASSAEVELPDGSTTMALSLGRDCNPEVPPQMLGYESCLADMMVMRTYEVAPSAAAAMFYEMSGPESEACGGEISPLYAPRNSPMSASYAWSCGNRTGRLFAFLVDPDDPESGIVAFGEWETGGTAPLMEMQFSEMARSVRLSR